jgi:hypothetical protein
MARPVQRICVFTRSLPQNIPINAPTVILTTLHDESTRGKSVNLLPNHVLQYALQQSAVLYHMLTLHGELQL